MMRYGTLLLAMLVATANGYTQDAADASSGEEVTIVTSDHLTYDAQAQFALFEKNVVVTDPQLQLTSDELKLIFDDEGGAKSIEATGNVNISQGDKKSISGAATYDVETGKIVLTGKPRVWRGNDVLQGDTITFWRDRNKLVCEPQAKLVIFPQKGGAKSQLFGDE